MAITGHKTRSAVDRYDIVNENGRRVAVEKLGKVNASMGRIARTVGLETLQAS